MKQAPIKTGLSINGQQMDLESFFLNVIERPLPKEPTHYVVAEVLNTDLSIKRVTVYFNPLDTWKGDSCFFDNTPKAVGKAIGSQLHFINSDPNTLAYKYWVIEILTNNMVYEGSTYSCTKCRW